MSRRIDVIDLSHHNTVASMATVAASGVLGVIHKCTEGTGYVDPTYDERQAAAREAGLAWCAYHFVRGQSAQEQAEAFIAAAGLGEGDRLVLDHEAADATPQTTVEMSHILYEQGYEVTIYCSQSACAAFEGIADTTAASLWVARYTSAENPGDVSPWPTWSLWQYSDKGQVPGISGPVDVNCFNGSRENCAIWLNRAQPEPILEDRTVRVSIEADAGVTVVVNGRVME